MNGHAGPSALRDTLGLDASWEQVADLTLAEDEDDDEWEETEELLTLDFGEGLTQDTLSRCSDFQLAYLNSSTPFANVHGAVFRGQYEQLVGTELVMQQSTRSEDDSKPSFAPIGSVHNRIRFQPVSLEPRSREKRPTSSSGSSAGAVSLDDEEEGTHLGSSGAESDGDGGRTGKRSTARSWFDQRLVEAADADPHPRSRSTGRPRGRPPKRVHILADRSTIEAQTPPPKRPRGRPRGSRSRGGRPRGRGRAFVIDRTPVEGLSDLQLDSPQPGPSDLRMDDAPPTSFDGLDHQDAFSSTTPTAWPSGPEQDAEAMDPS